MIQSTRLRGITWLCSIHSITPHVQLLTPLPHSSINPIINECPNDKHIQGLTAEIGWEGRATRSLSLNQFPLLPRILN